MTRRILIAIITAAAITIPAAAALDNVIVGTQEGDLYLTHKDNLSTISSVSNQGYITAVASLSDGRVVEGTQDATYPKVRIKDASNLGLNLASVTSQAGNIVDIEIQSNDNVVAAGTQGELYAMKGSDNSLNNVTTVHGGMTGLADLSIQTDDEVLTIQSGGISRIRYADTLSSKHSKSGLGSNAFAAVVLPNGNTAMGFNTNSGLLRLRDQTTVGHVASKTSLNSDLDWVDMAVLSTGNLVVVADKKIQIYSGSNLNRLSNWTGWSGDGNITAVTVQSDDDIIVGTDTGRLYRYRWSGVNGEYVDYQDSVSGLGTITDLAIQVPEPATITILLSASAIAFLKRKNA